METLLLKLNLFKLFISNIISQKKKSVSISYFAQTFGWLLAISADPDFWLEEGLATPTWRQSWSARRKERKRTGGAPRELEIS